MNKKWSLKFAVALFLALFLISALSAFGITQYQRRQNEEAKRHFLEYKPGLEALIIVPGGYTSVEFKEPLDLGGGLLLNYLTILPLEKLEDNYLLILKFTDDRIKIIEKEGIRLHYVYPRLVENILPIVVYKNPPGQIAVLYDLGSGSGEYEIEILPDALEGPSGKNEGLKLDLKLVIEHD